MKPTIKYLLNGEYHYATVKDIGDIEKLTTAVKTDLVSAINSISGGGGSVPPDLQQIIDDLQSQLEGIINGGLNDNQLLEMQKAMDESIAAMNAELQIKIDNLKTDYENKFTQVTGDYDQKVAIIKGDVTGLRDDLDATELSLKETGEKLSGIELNYTNVTQEVDNVKGSLLTKVESSDFELLESTVNANKTEIKQTKESIDLMATKESLDLATGNISDLSAKLEVQAGEIASTVKKEELKNELDGLDIYAKNILEGTTDWNGWTPVNPSNVRVLSDTYQHTQIQEQTGFGAYEETSLKDLVIGKTYTASVWARSTNIKAQPVFKINGVNSIMANKNKDTYMGSEWQRFSVKFVASAEAVTVSFTTISTVSGNKSYFAGGKVEIGTTNTGWRPSESDVFGRVVSAESSIKQQADKITSVVTQQEKIGADVTKHSTAINQLSGSIELQAKSLTEIEGKVSQNEASIKVANDSIKSKVEQSDIDKSVDGMRLDNKNAVLNSDFQREFSDWTGVNSLFKIVEINGKKYAKATRTGLTGNLPATLTTNKMPAVKGDRLMIGFDMIVDDLAKYDVQTAVMLELFNISDVRVDFKEFTLAELTGSLKNGVAGRLNTNYKIARDDVAKASLRLNLYRNGTVAYTNISMQKGDIGSTEWMPAPEDSQLIQATLKTEIDQNARDITLRATSETVNKISGDLAANTASLKVANDAITAHTQSLTKVDGKISEHDAKLVQTAKELSSKMTSTEVDSMLDKKGYATQSELKQTSEGFEIAVGSVREDTEKAIQGYDILNDKTSILSGNPIYTDKADDAVVHVGVDGKSEQTVVEGNTNLVSGSFDTMTDFDLAMNGPEFEVSSKLVPEILKGGLYTASAYIGSVTVTKGLSVMISIRNSNGSAYKQYDGAQKMSVGQSGLLVCTAEIPEITGVTGLRVTAHLRDSSGTGSKGTYRALKLEKGSTATPIPTPSPDYSSEIKSLDKSFDIVSSVGKSNLLPNSNKIVTSPNNTGLGTAALMGDESTPYYRIIATNTISTYETPIWNWMMANAIVGKQYTLSVDVRTPTGGAVNFMGGTTTSATGDIKQNVWTRVYLTFNYVSGKRYGGLVHSDKQLDYRNWKLEEGSFSPYSIIESEIQPNTPSPTSYKTNILLSEPLRSVGDVKDRLFLDSDGLWKVERNVKERIFNGNESFAQNTIGEKTVRYQYNTGVASLKHIREQIMIKSSHFQGHSNSTWTSDIEMIEQDSENINFRINKARMSEVSVAGFKNWLKSNNAIVQYSVATPTIETLPQSEQVKLNNIQSFKGSNYVYTVDGSGVVPNLNTIFKSAGWASKAKIKDVTNSVDDLESTTLPALSDGLLNKAEKESITQSLNIIRAEKTGLDSQYNSVYGNSILAGSQKTNLYNAKVAFNTAHSNLSAAIMAVLSVADNVRINQTLISKVSTEFANYGTAVATLKTRFEEALDMISGKKSSDAEANAKAHTNAQIKVMDDKIVSKVSATDFTGAKIASLISQSPDTIKIAAKNIELSGKVTFTDFDSGAQAKINEKSTKTEAQSYANSAQTKAEANAKAAAESVAAAKANLAETTAKAYADGKVTAEEKARINDANAKLAAAKKHAEDQVGNLEIGGRNYFKKSHSFRQLAANSSFVARGVDTPNGFTVTGNSASNGVIRLDKVITENGWWTISFDIKGSQSASVGMSVDICDLGKTRISTNATNTYKRVSLSVFVTNYSSATYNFVDFEAIAWAHFWVDNIKVEKGQKATDWSPAPEDVDAAIDLVNQAANNAQKDANSAAGSAKTANNLLTDLANDNKLTASEKKEAKKEWDIIVGEKPKIEAEATKYAIGTEKSTFATRYNTLNSYISPLLTNLNATSDIVGATFRANFKNYYDSRQDLLNAITSKAKSLADTAQSLANTANGTANTAKTNAATAQNAANTANSGVNAINGKINNAVTTIDGTGVTVKDGSFYLEDDSSSVKYSMQTKTNPIIDHGFELLMPKFKHATLDIWSIDSQANADGTRRSKGDSDLTIEGPSEPYIYVSYIKDVGSDMSSTPIFGSTSGVACSTAYFTTLVSNWIKPSKQYTVSAFFKKVPGLTGGMPKIVVQHVRGVANTILSTITNPTYGAVTSEINAIRYSATFTSPSSFSATSMDKIKLSFTSGNSNWVMVDGLQVAESSFPNQYNDEKTAFDIARGDFKFPVMRTDYLLATGKADVFGDMQVTQEFSAGRYVSRELKANEDLNNIKAEGWYHCPLSATAATIKNTPSNMAFSVFVEKHAGTKQTFTTYEAGNPKMWMRNEYFGWGNWKIMVDDSSWRDLSLRNVTRGNLKYRYMDGKVNLNGWIDRTGEQRSGIAIANLPTWASPPTDTRFLGVPYEYHTSYPEQHACSFQVKASDGEISIQRKTGVERWYINETFMA